MCVQQYNCVGDFKLYKFLNHCSFPVCLVLYKLEKWFPPPFLIKITCLCNRNTCLNIFVGTVTVWIQTKSFQKRINCLKMGFCVLNIQYTHNYLHIWQVDLESCYVVFMWSGNYPLFIFLLSLLEPRCTDLQWNCQLPGLN